MNLPIPSMRTEGAWREALTVRQGYNLNYNLRSMQTDKHQGALPGEHAFIEVKSANVVLTAVKKAEDDDDLVFRLYEWGGKHTDVTIQLPPGAQSAQDADLMEHPIAELPVQAGKVTVHAKPYEIKTLKVRFALPLIPQQVQTE